MDSIDSSLRKTARTGLLRYAVQRAIFCPRCSGILDMRRAWILANSVYCAACVRAVLATPAGERVLAALQGLMERDPEACIGPGGAGPEKLPIPRKGAT